MNNKVRIGFLLLIVNGLLAMSRLGPLSSQSLSNLRRYVPSNFSAASNRALNTSGNLSQVYPGAVSKVKYGFKGVSAREPGVARRMALLQKKIQEEKNAGSFSAKLRAYDKKIQQTLKESLIGSVLTTIGLTLGGRYLYDSYVANKKAQADAINTEIQTQIPEESSKSSYLKTSKEQEWQSGWTNFKNAISDRWGIFTKKVVGSV